MQSVFYPSLLAEKHSQTPSVSSLLISLQSLSPIRAHRLHKSLSRVTTNFYFYFQVFIFFLFLLIFSNNNPSPLPRTQIQTSPYGFSRRLPNYMVRILSLSKTLNSLSTHHSLTHSLSSILQPENLLLHARVSARAAQRQGQG